MRDTIKKRMHEDKSAGLTPISQNRANQTGEEGKKKGVCQRKKGVHNSRWPKIRS